MDMAMPVPLVSRLPMAAEIGPRGSVADAQRGETKAVQGTVTRGSGYTPHPPPPPQSPSDATAP